MYCWCITDKGIVRRQNEDTYITHVVPESEIAVCIVCDGMGGARAGSVASAEASNEFMAALVPAMQENMSMQSLTQAIKVAVDRANAAVFAEAVNNPEYNGMGTTIVGVAISGENTAVLNIGDSRAYRINNDGIFRITRDHSVVEDMIDRGDLTREQARSHPSKNLITRAIGTDSSVMCDIYDVELKSGEYILLCSDGLTNMISEQEILYEILHGEDIDTCCQRMLEIVISRGAPDNVTIVLLQR